MAEIMVLDWPHASIRMLVSSEIERAYRLRACAKEPFTADWLRTLGPDDVLVNVGANVGSYALCAAAQGAHVIAIEPNILNLARLCENVLLNGMGEGITPAWGVVGRPTAPFGSVYYQNPARGVADNAIDVPAIGSAYSIRAMVMALDAVGPLAGFTPQPTHLLVDVDGSEIDVLSSGPFVLAHTRSVMIEMQPENETECSVLLADAGLHRVGRWTERNGQPMGVVYSEWRRQG